MVAVRVTTYPWRWSGWLVVLALLALSAGPASAVAKPPDVPLISNEVSVTLAEIPVEVVRNGEPVTGLNAADFEVKEGSRSLPIVAFEPIDLAGAEKAGSPPPSPAARRHLLFLFDFAFTRPEWVNDGVTAARELVATGLAPHDLVAVGVYLPKGELQLLLSFTTDRAAATRTLDALTAMLRGEDLSKEAEGSDPLRLTGLGARSLLNHVFRVDDRNLAADMLQSLGSAPSIVAKGNGAAGKYKEDALQRNVLAHSSVVQQPEVESRQRGHVMAMADAMEGLAEVLRSINGRKYLTLFSEGFSMNIAESYGDVETPSGGGSLMLGRLDKAIREMQRSGWVLNTVSLGGTRGGAGVSGLFYLANESGGQLVERTNQLAEGLNSTLRRSAHGYLLTVELDGVAPDGAFHKVDVRLREERRAKVFHRGGYFAPLPFSNQKDVQRLAEAATLVGGDEERDDLGVEVVAVPLRTGAESTAVAIVVEVPGASLLASGAPRIGLEVYGYALDAKGNSTDFFAQAVDLDSAKLSARLNQGGVRVLGKLDLPSGQHRLRVLVRDRGNGRLSLLSVPVSLATASAEVQVHADALFLPPADDPWVLVRPAESSLDLHGRAVLPAAHGSMAAAGEAQVLLLGRGLTGKGTWVRERILTSAGKPIAGGTLELLTVTPGEAGEPDLVLGRLRAGSLPPGEYLLELRFGEDGVARAVTARPFLIAGPVR